jgi:hypothetical protein
MTSSLGSSSLISDGLLSQHPSTSVYYTAPSTFGPRNSSHTFPRYTNSVRSNSDTAISQPYAPSRASNPRLSDTSTYAWRELDYHQYFPAQRFGSDNLGEQYIPAHHPVHQILPPMTWDFNSSYSETPSEWCENGCDPFYQHCFPLKWSRLWKCTAGSILLGLKLVFFPCYCTICTYSALKQLRSDPFY